MIPYAIRVVIVSFGLCVIIWFILTIELTLAWNNVELVYGITSVGQLIPFIIGLIGLLRVIHAIMINSAAQVSLAE